MEERPAVRAAREAHSWLQTLTVGLIALVLLFVFAGQPVLVDGDSMLPTLRDRELMLVRRAGCDPQPGDVVVLRKDFEFGLNLYRHFLCVQKRRYWYKNLYKICWLMSPYSEAKHGFKGNCKGNLIPVRGSRYCSLLGRIPLLYALQKPTLVGTQDKRYKNGY